MSELQLSEKVKDAIRDEITHCSGNEIFFIGSIDKKLFVDSVEVLARGNKFSVPALVDSARAGDVVIHNHPSGNLYPSDQDIAIASIFGNNGVGFLIVDNHVDNSYVVVEPYIEEQYKPLDKKELGELLAPGGRFSKVMKDRYEFRQGQIDMVDEVINAFNQNGISLAEAGTGIGKTFAYLIPSIKWSLQNNEKVLISTNTINLQEQLIEKDIPLVKKCLDEKFKYSLVKGMGNYICLLRLETASEGVLDLIEKEDEDDFKEIAAWSKITKDGSLSDLNFNPPNDIWDKVSAESESCIRAKCPYYSDCFYFKARKELASSNIIISNHHLTFSDLSIKSASIHSESGVLPPYKRVVFDEAHNVEDVARIHFGMRASKIGILRALGRLRSVRSKSGRDKGVLFYIHSMIQNKKIKMIDNILEEQLNRIQENLIPRVEELYVSVSEAFDHLFNVAFNQLNENERSNHEFSIRISEDLRQTEVWGEIQKNIEYVRIKISQLNNEIKEIIKLLLLNERNNEFTRISVELRSVESKLDYYSEVLSTFVDISDDGFVRWIEGREGKTGIFVNIGITPLDISKELQNRLYESCKTVVLTSATISVAGDFSFIKSQLGLIGRKDVSENSFQSPFNYKEKMLLAIPADLPEPGRPRYSRLIADLISKAVKSTKGNALVLFTSYNMLNIIHNDIKEDFYANGIVPLKQGTEPRNRLLEKFRLGNSALFATDSFWQGIDVPGEALGLVVIARLPFKVPTDPIVEALLEHFEQQGLNSFLDYSVPTAVIKFKQGVGRLIRTKNDKGIVLVLDKRIITKRYGKKFIDSLPSCRTFIGASGDLLDELKNFYNQD